MMKALIAIALLTTSLLIACDVGDGNGTKKTGPGWTSDPRDATDPDGKNTPLGGLPTGTAEDALKAAADAIDKYRAKGVEDVAAALNAGLPGAGVNPGAIDDLNDKKVGQDLPTALDANGNPLAGVDITGQPILNGVGEYAKYFGCPILAPEPTQDNECAKVVQPIVLQVQNQIDAAKGDVAQAVADANPNLTPEGKSFVAAWAQEANQYGAQVAGIYAGEELRAAGACDTKVNAMKVSHNLGVEQGQWIVKSHYAWAQAQAAACVVSTDVIAMEVKTMSLAEVTTFMSVHKVCVGVDVSTGNAVLVTAEEKREEGIKVGIENQVQVLRGQLMIWTAVCRARAGDPLVIDLDQTGLSLSSSRVSFDLLGDGNPMKVSWVGSRMAMLAMDLDGDGRITTGAELFGERQSLDAVSALSKHDSNGDGLIDARDAVFSKLMLWTDSNQDGVSQPSELRSLTEAGVLSIGLSPTNNQVQVLTTSGFRTGHDVWLEMQLSTANLAALKP
jgi:hypothetical protein